MTDALVDQHFSTSGSLAPFCCRAVVTSTRQRAPPTAEMLADLLAVAEHRRVRGDGGELEGGRGCAAWAAACGDNEPRRRT